MTFSLLGLRFSVYGLLVGLAAAVGIGLVEKKAGQHQISQQQLWTYLWPILLGSLLGARAWHVATDYHLYVQQPWQAFYIWNGGLSILGAVLGALVVGWGWHQVLPAKSRLSLPLLADISIFGLPIAQAIGRLGNFVNQELYGWPSSLPWAIPIRPENRVSGFEMATHFHPLFAYEMIFTAGFGVAVWWLADQQKIKLGSGRMFGWYVLYYSLVRFCLDFLRIEKTSFGVIGVNQAVLLGVMLVVSWWLARGVRRA